MARCDCKWQGGTLTPPFCRILILLKFACGERAAGPILRLPPWPVTQPRRCLQ